MKGVLHIIAILDDEKRFAGAGCVRTAFVICFISDEIAIVHKYTLATPKNTLASQKVDDAIFVRRRCTRNNVLVRNPSHVAINIAIFWIGIELVVVIIYNHAIIGN